jgi:3-oxoacyl-[acyl-carrier protein] reductase
MTSNLFDLTGRTAVVTGAGGGIGRGLALALGAAGANVVIAARRAETGEPVAEEIRASGGSALCIRTDVSNQIDVEQMVDETVRVFGGLDVMVHNAISGHSTDRTPVQDLSQAVFDEVVDVAVNGAFYCARAALPHLRTGRGRYILILAHGGVRGHGALSAYGIAKGMQRGLFKALTWELGADGIAVNAIVPFAMTEGMERYYATNPTAQSEQAARLVLGRIGMPELDVGGAAVFFASDAAGYITGQSLFVDGGSYFL